MRETDPPLPDPTLPAVAQWLKGVDRESLHKQGWVAANKRFHGLALAARPFINKHFTDAEQQEAAFDGMTLALMALSHFEDIESLLKLFNDTPADAAEADR